MLSLSRPKPNTVLNAVVVTTVFLKGVSEILINRSLYIVGATMQIIPNHVVTLQWIRDLDDERTWRLDGNYGLVFKTMESYIGYQQGTCLYQNTINMIGYNGILFQYIWHLDQQPSLVIQFVVPILFFLYIILFIGTLLCFIPFDTSLILLKLTNFIVCYLILKMYRLSIMLFLYIVDKMKIACVKIPYIIHKISHTTKKVFNTLGNLCMLGIHGLPNRPLC